MDEHSLAAPMLTPGELFAAALLLVVPIAASRHLEIGLERKFIVAALRAAVQLYVLGFVLLEPLFTSRSPTLVLGYVALLLLIAATEVRCGYPRADTDGAWCVRRLARRAARCSMRAMAALIRASHPLAPPAPPHRAIRADGYG